MIFYYSLAILAYFITALGQVLIKIAAKSRASMFSKVNITGALLLLVCVPISLFTLSKMDFSVFYSFSALTYVFITLFASYFLHEKIDLSKVIGVAIVVAGVLIFNIL